MGEDLKEKDALLVSGFSPNKLLAKRTIKQFQSYQTKHLNTSQNIIKEKFLPIHELSWHP